MLRDIEKKDRVEAKPKSAERKKGDCVL